MTQGNGHLAVSTGIIQDIVRTVKELLEHPSEPHDDVTLEQIQSAQLKTVLHLWIVTKFAVGPLNEEDTASALLSTVLESRFDLDNAEIKSSWSEVCSELMIAQDPLLLSSLQNKSDSQSESELRRHMWRIVAEKYTETDSEEDLNWERKAKLLLIPMT